MLYCIFQLLAFVVFFKWYVFLYFGSLSLFLVFSPFYVFFLLLTHFFVISMFVTVFVVFVWRDLVGFVFCRVVLRVFFRSELLLSFSILWVIIVFSRVTCFIFELVLLLIILLYYVYLCKFVICCSYCFFSQNVSKHLYRA